MSPESARIRALLEMIGDAPGVEVGPGDDAAVVEAGGTRVVLTVDRQREGTHYRSGWIEPVALGRRAVAVAVSDIGAMGATPSCAVVALGSGADPEWERAVTAGAAEAGREFGCPIVGGDLLPRGPGDVVVTVLGHLPAGQAPLRRSGASSGDECWVLGRLGHAAAGRTILATGAGTTPDREPFVDAWRAPRPPLRLASEIGVERLVTAMMDVSDGLGADLPRLCAASGCGARIDRESLSDPDLEALAAELGHDPLDWITAGGEDYALLCAVPPAGAEALVAASARHAVPARRIGRFIDGNACLLADGETDRPLGGGWDPFPGESGDPAC